MTPTEWQSSDNPYAMLRVLGDRLTFRKYRLLRCGFCRANIEELVDERSVRAVVVAEQYADGLTSEAECGRAREAAGQAIGRWRDEPDQRKKLFAGVALSCLDPELSPFGRGYHVFKEYLESNPDPDTCHMIRDLFNPFLSGPATPSWLTSTVISLARQMYDQRDFATLPILADALQDVGCEDVAILDHCRGQRAHQRGCWVVDLVLGMV